jgi:chitin disaccharide deacetylase
MHRVKGVNVRWCLSAASIVFGILSLGSASPQAQTKTIAERLGYPADAKLVILHADDLAVAHSVDMAAFAALDQKAVSSASIMVPCPWLTEVAAYAKAHPDADLGLHLTLTSEWSTYRWGPVASKDQVSSLLDPEGYFYAGVPAAATHIKPEEAEREIRAQIELAMKMGIHPTHLDMHMGTLAATPQLYATLVKVGHEYHLPFLAVHVNDARNAMMSLLSPTDIVLDSLVMFNPGVPSDQWTASYVKALGSVKPGLHYLIVHLGHDDAELQAVTVGHPDYGAAWRQRDFNAVTSPEFKRALEENHIILVGWKDLKKLLE